MCFPDLTVLTAGIKVAQPTKPFSKESFFYTHTMHV